MTEENFDRLDYEVALTYANQLLPVQPTETLNDVADILVLWWVLLTLLSIGGGVSFVLCRQLK